jgi:hypothetical protein
MEGNSLSESDTGGTGRRFEITAGLILAVLAAILAITDLGASKFGEDEIMGTNEKANQYSWYQSKSVKQTLVEGQKDLLRTLIDSGSINSDKIPALNSMMANFDEDITRYKKEKTEILLGSKAVGKDNWIQDIDGELGKVIGAKAWEKKLEVLSRAGDKFDIAILFLQLSLVIGAISLVLHQIQMKWGFIGSTVVLGIVGTAFSIKAFLIAMSQ